ncbi:MAG: phosphatase PAP2 family protein [Ruminococcaceae bacterium]|nr:phosphatase PAP2 family protein [Oscillospiraceae bacterium]
MKEQQYKQMSEYFGKTKQRSTTVKALHDILPVIMMVFYPVQLIYLFVTTGFNNEVFLKATFVPLFVLIFVTVLRYIVNAKRPYEVYDYAPVVSKKTKGKSFPSRHTASAFIIAMAFLYIQTSLGVIMLCLATVIAITRVLSGVHFVRDVIGGALISILIGTVCFFLI